MMKLLTEVKNPAAGHGAYRKLLLTAKEEFYE